MNGERIKLARRRAGLSLRDLANRMNHLVSAQAIGKYERGEMLPSSTVLISLTKALGVSIPYLLRPEALELGSVEFRSKSSTSARDRARVETAVIEWVERYLQIEEILDLQGASWCCPEGMPKRVRNFEDAERLAKELRKEWQLGIDPIPNMTEVLEERGIKVLLEDLPSRVSGLTCIVKRPDHGEETPVIVVNRAQTLERRRFNMAHELGHRIVAPNSEGDIEKLCHRFAGAFLVNKEHLLGETGVRRSAVGVREVMDLKRLYRVSASALLMRLEQVEVIDPSQKEYAFRTYAKTWRSAEPEPLESAKQQGVSETPMRFERLVYRAAAEDLISLSKAVELLCVPISEVERGLKGPALVYANHR